MMRSLWAGVSGLQAHQIAMDVEGNNISNVNTAGFKYSRANFSDLLSQNSKIATAPQGELGGKNPMQVGLGTQVSSITKIFKQGSVQNTDKNTDLAIQGDGFFVISPDGGSTYKYTRNGDFDFDASGNFTDSNGYIIQGWLRDNETGEIDATTPIQNITIPPGLTTPAKDTAIIDLKANLNSSNKIESKSPIYSLDSHAGWVDANGDGIRNAGETHDEDVDAAIFNIDNQQKIYEKGQDFGTLFDSNGEAIELKNDEGIWASYANAEVSAYATGSAIGNVTFELNGVTIEANLTGGKSAENAALISKAINDKSGETGIIATSSTDGKVSIINRNDDGTTDEMKNIEFKKIGSNPTGLFEDMNLASDLENKEVITAFKYLYSNASSNYEGVTRNEARIFNSTEDLRDAMQSDARLNVDYLGLGSQTGGGNSVLNKNDGVEVTVNNSGQFQVTNPKGDAFNEDDLDIVDATDDADNEYTVTASALGEDTTYESGSVIGPITPNGETITLTTGTRIPSELAAEITDIDSNAVDANNILQYEIIDDGADLTIDGTTNTDDGGLDDYDTGTYTVGANPVTLLQNTIVKPALERPLEYQETHTIESGFHLPETTTSFNIPEGTIVDTAAVGVPSPFIVGTNVVADGDRYRVNQVGGVDVDGSDDDHNAALGAGNITLPDDATLTLPAGSVLDPNDITGTGSIDLPPGANYIDVNDHDMNLAITSYTDQDTAENKTFTSIISTMQGSLPTGADGKFTQSLYAASHASSIDVYDSLGSKHTVRLEFKKSGVTDDGGMQWDVKISVPKPAVINPSADAENQNIITGNIKFASDGSLDYYTPTTISFTGNNGSSPNQSISMNLGSIGQFDGVTSFDSPSNTSGISQDGYPGGDLEGVRVDETGTLIGSFTNGRSFGLAQVAMANFSNNGGLESDGGNTFIQTSNSGDPIIGQAAVGGRGFIQASSLEMSNVDLSRSLTQLIVVQRGYQANSKAITTSDQMLDTLLQLKR